MARAALIDDNSFVINTIVVDDYSDYPGCIPAEDSGDTGDWWNGAEFVNRYDPRHPKYAGPYVPSAQPGN